MKNEYGELKIKKGIAIIWMDQEGRSVNLVSIDLINAFNEILNDLYANKSVKGIIFISRKKDFIAGADIEYFLNSVKEDEWLAIGKKGHNILDRMAKSKKPIVAAINGACLGGGLEIALACHSRIVSDAKHTKLALPEVQLGLLPGGGGTQRLPSLIGLQNALDMLLTGKNIYPYKAMKLGLADAVVNEHNLLRAAELQIENLLNKTYKRTSKLSLKDKLLENNAIGRNIIFNAAQKKVLATTKGNYPAPLHILECVKAKYKSVKAGKQKEVELFNELLKTPVSKQLQNIFFNITAKKNNPDKGISKPVNKLAMIGAGFMGAGIAEISAVKEIEVYLKDLNFSTISEAKETIWKNLSKKIKRKALNKFEAELILSRVNSQIDYAHFNNVDIIIEAVFEDLTLKQKILNDCENISHNSCIFASNTSAISIDKIAAKAQRPELVVGLHYFSPVPKMPLLEIVRGSKTADWVISTCFDLGIRQGKTCIVVNDGPGFYTTRILAPMLNEAMLLLEEGADILKVDALMQKVGYPVGPYNLIDEVGIDVGAHIMEGELMDKFLERPGAVASNKLKDMYAAGFSGRKNNKGFYLYDKKTNKRLKGKINHSVYNMIDKVEKKVMTDDYISDRILLSMVNEAAHCLDDKIIENVVDGDIGAIFGLGFPPFLGGPFRYIDSVGAKNIVNRLNRLIDICGERYKPADCILSKAENNSTFY